MKKILYVRVSSIDQNTDRQKINENDYDLVIEDKCMGTIAFFDRTGSKEIQKISESTNNFKLIVWKIDRLGRDLRDIINTIHFFTNKKIQKKYIISNFDWSNISFKPMLYFYLSINNIDKLSLLISKYNVSF